MRAFTGIELPAQSIERIIEIQHFLQSQGIRARWTRPELMHITLAFIFDLKPSQIDPVSNILENVALTRNSFTFTFSNLIGFPKLQKAYILGLGLNGETKKLAVLDKFIKRGLSREKVPHDQKPFVPHITLGRARRYLSLQSDIPSKLLRGEFVINKISLFKSELFPQGPVYTKLHTVSLPVG